MSKAKSHYWRFNGCLILISLVWSFIVAAEEQSDVAAEPVPELAVDLNAQRDQELAESMPPDQVKWIDHKQGKFLALFKSDQTGNPKGSVLMVPAPGDTIKTPGVMTQAVDYFPSVSWHLMAVHPVNLSFEGPEPILPTELPATSSKSESEQAEDTSKSSAQETTLPDEKDWYEKQFKTNQQALVNRLMSAEQELLRNDKGYVLVVTSYSASLVLEAIKENKLKPRGLVLIDIDYPVLSVRLQLASELAAIRIPVLDIYSVVTRPVAEQRSGLGRQQGFEQKMLPATGRNFRGSEQLLFRTIRGWLNRRFER